MKESTIKNKKEYTITDWGRKELNHLEVPPFNIKKSTKMLRFMESKEVVIHNLNLARNVKEHKLLNEFARS